MGIIEKLRYTQTCTCTCDITYRSTTSLHITFLYTSWFCFTLQRECQQNGQRYQQKSRHSPFNTLLNNNGHTLFIDNCVRGEEDYTTIDYFLFNFDFVIYWDVYASLSTTHKCRGVWLVCFSSQCLQLIKRYGRIYFQTKFRNMPSRSSGWM